MVTPDFPKTRPAQRCIADIEDYHEPQPEESFLQIQDQIADSLQPRVNSQSRKSP